MYRFLDLLVYAQQCLAGPTAWHPLLLELATTLPKAGLRGATDAFHGLHHLGNFVLRAVVSIAAFTKAPGASCCQLKEQVDGACCDETIHLNAVSMGFELMILNEKPHLQNWQLFMICAFAWPKQRRGRWPFETIGPAEGPANQF